MRVRDLGGTYRCCGCVTNTEPKSEWERGGKPEGDLDETVPDDVIGGSSPLLEERSTWLPAHKSPGECGMLPFFSLASLVVKPFPSSDFTSGTAPSSGRSWWAIMSPPGGRLPARRVRRVYDWRWLLRLPHTWTGVSCNMCAPTDAGVTPFRDQNSAVIDAAWWCHRHTPVTLRRPRCARRFRHSFIAPQLAMKEKKRSLR
ncbi:hypothetical protein HPB51_003099 [Rhipicephalus microplus]|uniref:Uncharacterized protein n=1 Tax=Rhipicephalus microplus TaxID=6941 RepID=A0A9J6EWL3_RHIMP|nr:hypothetical protein HPB51_003099 [Rhipicephalus microplus]